MRLAASLCAVGLSVCATAKLAPSSAVVSALARATESVAELEAAVDAGNLVEDLGARFESISAACMESFETSAERTAESFAEERSSLEESLDARLELVYAKQLRLLREAALTKSLAAGKASKKKGDKASSSATEFEQHTAVDDEFCRLARASKKPGASWDFALERESLSGVMHALFREKKRATDAQLDAASQQSNYMRLYKAYASQIQHLQQQQYSPQPPLNVGFWYRVPGSEINLQGGYQQGKASLQVAAVDDESIIAGDPPAVAVPSQGNVGLSLNL